MPVLSRLACAVLLVSVVACTAPAVDPPSPTPTLSPAPAVSPLPLPVAADLPFPEPRPLPIRLPKEPTPQRVIDAFLDLVHDPALTYHGDGVGRWVRGDLEILAASGVDHAGPDRYLQLADSTNPGSELIVLGESAVGRLGGGNWLSIDPGFTRHMHDLSTTVVIGDLGPESDATGYRLVIDSGFDGHPRQIIEGYGFSDEITEVVIDESGRPLRLSYHAWATRMIAGQGDLPEGYVTYTFEGVGGPLTIPPLPPGVAEVGSSKPAPTVLRRIAIPGGGLSVLMPGTPQTETRDLSFNGPGRGTGLDVAYAVLNSDTGLRFEVGSAWVPAAALDGLSVPERLKAVRGATSGRISSGDILGYRRVEMASEIGEEVVADGEYARSKTGLFRIRNVFIDDRLIVLSVGGPAEAVGSAEADEFLASLARD